MKSQKYCFQEQLILSILYIAILHSVAFFLCTTDHLPCLVFSGLCAAIAECRINFGEILIVHLPHEIQRTNQMSIFIPERTILGIAVFRYARDKKPQYQQSTHNFTRMLHRLPALSVIDIDDPKHSRL